MHSTTHIKNVVNKTALSFTAVLFVMLLSCCGRNKNEVLVRVNSDGIKGPVILMMMDTNGVKGIDSVIKPTGISLEFNFHLDEPGLYIIRAMDKETEFLASAGDIITLQFAGNHVNVSGSPDNNNYRLFINSLDSLKVKADSLSYLFMASQATDSFFMVRERTSLEFERLIQTAKNQVIDYINRNPKSMGIVGAMNSMIRQTPVFNLAADQHWFLLTDSLLQKYHPTSRYAISLHSQMNGYRQFAGKSSKAALTIARGKVFPVVKLPDLNGQMKSLKPMDNKLTLVYLWDGGSKSRSGNQKVKLLYERYKGRGLGIYAISFDENRKRWSSTIEIDKMWWSNVIDTTAQRSELIGKIGISQWPTYIVLNSEGQMLESFSNTALLTSWFQEYFNVNETKNRVN
ncbi:MAG: thioredoxin-like domain-containing protein [Lentimicrobiaceae bacterium]